MKEAPPDIKNTATMCGGSTVCGKVAEMELIAMSYLTSCCKWKSGKQLLDDKMCSVK